MADQKNRQDRAHELDEQQLDQVAGGTLSRTEEQPVGAPKKSFAAQLGDAPTGVQQVGLDVAAN